MPLYTNTTAGTVTYSSSAVNYQSILANDTDSVNNSNTVAAQSDFTIALGKNERIIGELGIWYFAHQNKDFRYQLVGPTGSIIRWDVDGRKVDGSANITGFLRYTLTIINSSTAGNFEYKWSANTVEDAVGNKCFLKAGSYLKYKKF
tara:strand:+ start:574 stop:1014 length:441 start_codon:yes stop_codon:yes gene_type:complete